MATSAGKTVGLILLIVFMLLVFRLLGMVAMAPFFTVVRGSHGLWKAPLLHTMTCNFGWPLFGTLSILSILIFILWLVAIFWIYGDAERRGMNGILWALLVLVGNIVGLIIYLILRTGSLPVQQTGAFTAAGDCCPACTKPVRSDFKLCPHCGVSLRQKCSSCGRNVLPEWAVCPFCGKRLKD